MFIAVPKEADSDGAQLWVATDEPLPTDARLVHAGGVLELPRAGWHAWQRPGELRALHHQSVALRGLGPAASVQVALEVGGAPRAQARVSTLPAALSAPGGRPLTFLLGSCYCLARDRSAALDAAYRALGPAHRPDFKILCGDQVYLDSPWSLYLGKRFGEAELRELFLAHYWETWSGSGGRPGLSALLRDGACFFAPDDHELWNNAPSRAPYVTNSWTREGREDWEKSARSLYALFQTPRATTRFAVPPLHFFVADTRLQRDADERRFMDPQALRELADWLRTLPGPGVLVLGQPLFAGEESRLCGNLTDWGLADYPQYRELVLALREAPHSVLILTGDVHYRRLAHTELPGTAALHELISSPLALVSGTGPGRWHEAPARFPAEHTRGVPRSAVHTDPGLQDAFEHFLLLQCSALGGAVRVQIFCIPLDPADSAPGTRRPVAELRLQ